LDRNRCRFFVLTFDGLDDLDGGEYGSEKQTPYLSDELDLVGERTSFQLVHVELLMFGWGNGDQDEKTFPSFFLYPKSGFGCQLIS